MRLRDTLARVLSGHAASTWAEVGARLTRIKAGVNHVRGTSRRSGKGRRGNDGER